MPAAKAYRAPGYAVKVAGRQSAQNRTLWLGATPVLCSRCPLPYEDLLDLSSRGTRQDAKRRGFECFEPHRPGLHMADDVLLARLGAGLATDVGGNDFSPLCVRFRDDRRVQHGWGDR